MCLFSGPPRDDSRAIEQARQARVNQGMQSIDSTFAQFNPEYYQGYENSAYALTQPDIERQYRDAVRQTTYALARGGNVRSSAGSHAYSDLEEARGRALLEARDNARSKADRRRADVETTRGNLVSQLNATADPSAAAQAAINQSQLLSAPPVYSPIANVFSNLTAQVADAQSQNRAGVNNWATRLFGAPSTGSRSSVSYVA